MLSKCGQLGQKDDRNARRMMRHEKNELLSGKTLGYFLWVPRCPRGKNQQVGVKRVLEADWIDESPMLHRALENLKFQWAVHPKQRRKFESSEDAASYHDSIRDWAEFHSNVADGCEWCGGL